MNKYVWPYLETLFVWELDNKSLLNEDLKSLLRRLIVFKKNRSTWPSNYQDLIKFISQRDHFIKITHVVVLSFLLSIEELMECHYRLFEVLFLVRIDCWLLSFSWCYCLHWIKWWLLINLCLSAGELLRCLICKTRFVRLVNKSTSTLNDKLVHWLTQWIYVN